MWQWVTTAPNPRSLATGLDDGQRGWRLHAVRATDDPNFSQLCEQSALCGLIPRHGWDLNMFVTDRCKRCAAKMRRGVRLCSLPSPMFTNGKTYHWRLCCAPQQMIRQKCRDGSCMDGARGARGNLTFLRSVRVRSCIRPVFAWRLGDCQESCV